MSAGVFGVVILALYVVLLLFLSFSKGRAKKGESSKDYFVGSGAATLLLVFSMMAAGSSAWTFQGAPASVYNNGITWGLFCMLWMVVIHVTASGVCGTRARILGQYHGFYTMGDMFMDYYDSKALPIILSILQLCALVPATMAQVKGTGLAVEIMTDGKVSYEVGVCLTVLVIILYVTGGGFESLMLVDTIQGMIFISIIWLSLVVIGVSVHGDFGTLMAAAEARNPLMFHYATEKGQYWVWTMALTFPLAQVCGGIAHPAFWQRFFGAKSGQQLKNNAKWQVFIYTFGMMFPVVLLGMFAAGFDMEIKTAENAVQMMMASISPVFGVLIGRGIVCAAMSTAAGNVFAASNIAAVNVVAPIAKNLSDKQVKRSGQVILVVFAILSGALALRPVTSITLLLGLQLSLQGGALFPLAGILLWKRATKVGSIAGIAGLFVTTCYLSFFASNANPLGIYSGFWGLIVGTLVFVVVSLVTKPVSAEHREAFLVPLEALKNS